MLVIWMWNITPLGGLSLHLGITSSLRLKSTPKHPTSSPDLLWCNSIRMDPYAHPQHNKVLKHFIHQNQKKRWYWWGIKYHLFMSLKSGLLTPILMWYQRVFKSLSSAYFSCKNDHFMSKRHFKRKYYWFLRMYGWSRQNSCIDSFIRSALKNGFLFYFGWVRRYFFLTLFMWETNIFAPIRSRPRLFGWCDYEY